jgi:CRISPR system Cascade subunit CasE
MTPGYLAPSNGTSSAQTKDLQPLFRVGKVLAFRLLANPTAKRDGKRYGLLAEDDQITWLRRKAEAGGFELLSVSVTPQGLLKDRKGKDGTEVTFLSVRFDGLLRVTDPQAFRATMEAGVGSAKGLGFGLLSVAPPG